MSKSVNKFIGLGNVGKDPEVFATGAGGVIVKFSLATSDRMKDASGEWQDKTEWINCVCFSRTAEIVRDYVKKGSKLYIEGKLQTSSWDDKASGQKRYKTEVVVFDVSLLSGAHEGSQSSSSTTAPAAGDDFDDPIPF